MTLLNKNNSGFSSHFIVPQSEKEAQPVFLFVVPLKVGQVCYLFVLQYNAPKDAAKVIYPKYSKHWPYTVAYTIDYVCSKMLNHGLNHGLFLSLFKLIPCSIHWIVYVLAYLDFIFEF